MSVEKLKRIKGLLIAAKEHQEAGGKREFASNMLELALDEMEDVSSEDIDVGLSVIGDGVDTVDEDFVQEVDELEDVDEVDIEEEFLDPLSSEDAVVETENASLYNIVRELKNGG